MRRTPAALGAADWLSLAAAPTFAVMATATAMSGDNHAALCSEAAGPWLLGGMMPMYLLMATFHLTPWFLLFSPRVKTS